MQIVIDIDEKTYNDIKEGKIYSSFRDVPLPEGHGKLIDAQDAADNLMAYKEIGVFGNYDKLTICGCIDRIENHVKPIIEVDKARRYN